MWYDASAQRGGRQRGHSSSSAAASAAGGCETLSAASARPCVMFFIANRATSLLLTYTAAGAAGRVGNGQRCGGLPLGSIGRGVWLQQRMYIGALTTGTLWQAHPKFRPMRCQGCRSPRPPSSDCMMVRNGSTCSTVPCAVQRVVVQAGPLGMPVAAQGKQAWLSVAGRSAGQSALAGTLRCMASPLHAVPRAHVHHSVPVKREVHLVP